LSGGLGFWTSRINVSRISSALMKSSLLLYDFPEFFPWSCLVFPLAYPLVAGGQTKRCSNNARTIG